MATEGARLHDEIKLMSGFAKLAQLHPSLTEQRLHGASQVNNGLVFGPHSKPDPSGATARISRTARILDSLAQVAVTEKEVLAVAVAYPNKKQVLFKCATNEGVSLEIRTYLEKLLQLLRRLSELNKPPSERWDSNIDSPPRDRDKEPKAIRDAQDEIYTLIFNHCMPKLRRRFEKAKAYLEDIKQEAKAYPVVNSFPAMTNFLDNAELISFCFAHSNFEALFRTEEFYRGEFITTLLRMLSASKSLASPNEPPRGVVEFLRGKAFRGKWVPNARGTIPTRERSHVITKVCMQPRSAAALVEWAMSPRFRTSFEKEVIFDFLDKTNTGSLSPELGKDLRGPLLNLTDFKQGGDFRAEIDKSVPFLQHHLNPKRHAECAIIVNAIKTPATKRPPFCNYIGVSKLSCFGCASFIKHFNKICRTDWQTSGTHHKIYPWGLLSEGTEPNSVQTEVLKEVHNDFRQILHRRCEDRFGPAAEPPSAISDSSASSGEGKPVGFQEASQTFRDVLIKGLRSEPQ